MANTPASQNRTLLPPWKITRANCAEFGIDPTAGDVSLQLAGIDKGKCTDILQRTIDEGRSKIAHAILSKEVLRLMDILNRVFPEKMEREVVSGKTTDISKQILLAREEMLKLLRPLTPIQNLQLLNTEPVSGLTFDVGIMVNETDATRAMALAYQLEVLGKLWG